MSTLTPGDAAPAFELLNADGELIKLSDFGPGKVIVYFYPAALTPGCTIQAIDFTAHKQAFLDAGYAIVGISPDTPDKLADFRTKKDLSIILLSDPERQAIEGYGAWGTKTIFGKDVDGVIRSTFVVEVDADGAATVLSAAYAVRAAEHVAGLAAQLGIAL